MQQAHSPHGASKGISRGRPATPGVDLMNGNVGIIVFTRGTHGCLSRHTWRGNIPFIKRSARSSHRHTYVYTYAYVWVRCSRRRVHDPLPTARGLTPVTYSEFRCRAEGWSRAVPEITRRFSPPARNNIPPSLLENNSSLHYARKLGFPRAQRENTVSLGSSSARRKTRGVVSRMKVFVHRYNVHTFVRVNFSLRTR